MPVFVKQRVSAKNTKISPIVLGWKFEGNGQVSMEKRETEISIFLLGNHGKCVPKISPTKNVVNFHHFCIE